MTFDKAKAWLEASGRPWWQLQVFVGRGNGQPTAEYVPPPGEHTANHMTASVQQFVEAAEFYDGQPGVMLQMLAKKEQKAANNTGLTITFSPPGTVPNAPAALSGQALTGLGSLGDVLAREREHTERLLSHASERAALDMDKMLLQRDKDAFAEFKKAELAKLEEDKEKYTSHSRRVKDGAEAAIGALADHYLAKLPGILKGSALSGTETAELPASSAPAPDPRDQVIEKIAGLIDGSALDFNGVVWLETHIARAIDRYLNSTDRFLNSTAPSSDGIPQEAGTDNGQG